MKTILDQFNKALLSYQTQWEKQDEQYSNTSYLYYDRVSYTEYNGLYDITWHAGNYGFQSSSKEHLAHPETKHYIDEDGYYEGYEDGLSWLIDILIQHADKVSAIRLRNPHKFGYNGNANWELVRLAEADVVFPNLHMFEVELYQIGDHNISYIGEVDGNGNAETTQILKKFPNLIEASIPATPDADFFTLDFPHLQHLTVQAGFDSKHFIKNLSKSPLLGRISLDFMDCMFAEDDDAVSDEEKAHQQKIKAQEAEIAQADDPKAARKEMYKIRLREAGFSEAEITIDVDKPNRAETLRLLKETDRPSEEIKETIAYYDEIGRWLPNGEYNWDNDIDEDLEEEETSFTAFKATAFEDYKALVSSEHLRQSWHFMLRENKLTTEQLKELHALNPKIQFLHILTLSDYYLSHKFKK